MRPAALHITLGLLLAAAFLNSACRQGAQPQTRASAIAVAAPAAAARWADEDRDGIPDRAELRAYSDRENFRSWFTAVAEAQFYRATGAWNEEQRDCAGLVRFAWREALRTHDRPWFQKMGAEYEPLAPDVRAYTLERGPLQERLFRTSFGSFEETDLTGETFSEYADARTLKEFNCEFVSRERAQALPGDLLFFHQPWVQKYPYHVMIFLGQAREAAEGANDWVVYHTGASPLDAGEVRKARLSTLERHPDRRWRPLVNNRNFLGFYRLKILN
ncbi:MAG: DUF1175 domain-containing protein [Acidobacteria bacterium]|nr:DUF1175 domain-containing protein [Acidobacteriota bacterium]